MATPRCGLVGVRIPLGPTGFGESRKCHPELPESPGQPLLTCPAPRMVHHASVRFLAFARCRRSMGESSAECPSATEVELRFARFAATTALLTSTVTVFTGGAVHADSADPNAQEIAASDYQVTGELQAASGFRPGIDGFQFQNYTNNPSSYFDRPVTNLTLSSMYRLFGDGICSYVANGECFPKPQVNRWMENWNDSMNGGHCYGMAGASLLLWAGRENVRDYRALGQFFLNKTADIRFSRNAPVQELIARQFIGQYLGPVKQAMIKGAPNEIVDKLVQSLKQNADAQNSQSPNLSESYTLGFYKRDMSGGHEVTPIGVEKMPDNTRRILIYDNNFPRQVRYITVDAANNWKYTTAANPNDAASDYDGDAGTRTLELSPVGPAQGKQVFSHIAHSAHGTTGNAPGKTVDISLEGDPVNHGHLLITDEKGGQIGFVNGQRIKPTIEGAEYIDIRADDSKERIEPKYQLPAGGRYTIVADGTGIEGSDTTAVSVIGDAYEVWVGNVNLTSSSKSTIEIPGDGLKVAYKSTDAQTPDIEIGASYENADYTVTAKRAAVGDGGEISVALPSDHDALIVDASKSGVAEELGLEIQRADTQKKETREFSKEGIDVKSGGSAKLDYDKWDEGGNQIELTVDGNTTELEAK
ncbi:hypothetical protein [Nocardia sp. NPDC051570]|uniref:hypothetical protein n=1 Tax=Nocardia sp. NPDC051570 TaxID=3364324 RepID=UPI0037BC26AF